MRLAATALIGRVDERAAVTAALDQTIDRRGSAIALVGDDGLGKTRLLREVARVAAESGCSVAVGRATPGVPVPFRPITEALLALDREIGLRNRDDAAEWLPFMSRLVPSWVADRPLDETTIPMIADALLTCLESAVGDRAIVFALEDLHWADEETIALAEFLADNLSTSRVLLLVTMRPEPDHAQRRFRVLETRGTATVIDLSSLDRGDVADLVRNCLGGSVMLDVEQFVYERCDGNPLFAEELLAGLQSSGSLAYGPAGWSVTSRITPRVPLTLADAVRDRFSALDIDDRALVGAAAVLGRRFDWRMVEAMTTATGDQVLAGLRRGEDAHLVEFRDGGHQFRHSLTCDVIRDLLPDAERRLLAARALDRLGEQPDHTVAAELAEQAGRHDVALAHLRAAAADDIARAALSSAVIILRRAELLANVPDDRIEVALELAAALLLAGDGAGARDVCEAADTIPPPDADHGARLHLMRARASMLGGDWARAARDVAAARSVGSTAATVLVEIESVSAHVCLNDGRHEEAEAHAEAAIEGGLDVGRPDIACEALEALGRFARFRDPAASSAAFVRATEIAEGAGLDSWRMRAMHELVINDAFIDWRFERLDVLRREAEHMGATLTLAVVDLHDAGSLLIGGDVAAARSATMRCLDACRRFRLSMLPMTLVHLAAVSACEGDRAGAAEATGEALSLAPDDLDVASQIAGWVDAAIALVDGDLEAWWDHLDRGMAIIGDSPGGIPSPWRGQWALAAAVEGDDEPARRLAASHAGVVGLNRVCLDLVDAVSSARSGHVREAERSFADADAFMARPRADLPRHLARLLVAPVAAEHGWGDPAAWLREADAWFADAAFAAMASHVRSVMRGLDVPVPRRGRGESEVPTEMRRLGVTSREMDVLLLVVERCTNREIAGQLHLSVRTVEKHVASLLAKTASPDRRSLATLLTSTV